VISRRVVRRILRVLKMIIGNGLSESFLKVRGEAWKKWNLGQEEQRVVVLLLLLREEAGKSKLSRPSRPEWELKNGREN
jgi:hypothetical protein